MAEYQPPAYVPMPIDLNPWIGAQPAQTTNALMGPYQPRYVSDNLPLIIADLLRAGGASDQTANRVGDRLGGMAKWTPPIAAIDAAGDIGGAIHDGRYRDAATNASLAATLGYWVKPVGRALGSMLPTAANRDAGMAAMVSRMPQEAPMPAMIPDMMPMPPVSVAPHWMNTLRRSGEFPPPANVNNRANMAPVLSVLP